MKKVRLAAVVTLAVFALTSCEKKEHREMISFLEIDQVLKSEIVEIWPGEDGCGLQVYDLFGGQTLHMGTVSVVTYNGSVYVKYEANEGCLITETHLFVGDIADLPVNGGGNPQIGHFPVSWEDGDGQQVVIHEIELDEDCFDIAAHAVVKCESGGEETAWAKEAPVFAIKSLMDVYWGSPSYAITGSPVVFSTEDWCQNFRYYSLSQAIGSTIDLVYFASGGLVFGNVTIGMDGDKIRFTIDSNTGDVLHSYLFVGSVGELYANGICNYTDFPYTDDEPGTTHIFEIPVSDLLNGDANTFAGSRWGWYISNYCPDC